MSQPGSEGRRLRVQGSVQGVGFRPTVYRLASQLDLTGFVLNDSAGVVIEIEGPVMSLDAFRAALVKEAPARYLGVVAGGPLALQHSQLNSREFQPVANSLSRYAS